MKDLKIFTIPFVGLKEGSHAFEFDLGDSFFAHFDYDDFNHMDLAGALTLVKKSTMLELRFAVNGQAEVNCDLTNEPYDQPMSGTYDLVIKFGPEFNDEHEDILILPHGEFEINVAHYFYELAVLSMPNKRVHPGVADGSLDSEVLKKLEELSIDNRQIASKEQEIDPRWDELKKLLTDK
ncbi:YceD family protein [Croceiramulus getboli]|nr:DUF177 domain-containing protein [Flavobacteriaceae bacterium YJPT1-3]